MMYSHRFFWISALMGLWFGNCADAPAQSSKVLLYTNDMASRVDAVFAEFDRPDSPGYAVGILQNNNLVYAQGYGSANLDYGIPITSHSVFNVASLSKQFTASALALLIQQGSVTLDDQVSEFISEFPERFGSVRIKHLVYMTSGLPEYFRQDRPGQRSWSQDYFTVEDAISASLAQPALDFEPGTAWAYSNVNYMLLAEIVERVSGLTFSEFTRRHIFEPLGMANTHFNDDVTRVVSNRVIGYNVREGGGFHHHDRISPHYGGSGLFTTLEDLASWDNSFYTHTLGGPDLTALLLSTMSFEHDKKNDAFGLVWSEYEGLQTLWYEGGDLGFSSYMVRFPDERFTVIVLSNLGSGRAVDKAREVINLFLKR